MNAQKFFDTMQYFGDPKIPENSDFATILDAYLSKLEQYGDDVLQAAADLMLTSRKHRNFPLLAECLEFCRAAQEALALKVQREAGKESHGKPSRDPWSDFRVNQANRMMNSDIGRLAAKEGWIIHLHDFCRENSRLPGNFESDKIRAQGLRNKAEREEMARAAGIQNPLVKSIARAMDSKRMRLATIAGRDV